MSLRRCFIYVIITLVTIVLVSCSASGGQEGPVGPAGPAGPTGPQGPPGESATARQEYIGSEECGACHEEQYAKFTLSGHPYKLTQIENGEPPVFPYDAITGGVQAPPEGYSWDDITYVIGGFGWKARFIDDDGFIITGDAESTTQYNYANEKVGTESGWAAYHAGEEKPYDCGSCHTTGFSPQGHQDGLEGIEGTWALAGIQCERCHGPGSQHAADPQGFQMTVDRSSQLCGQCHVRDDPASIDASGGFVQHHEQYEELFSSKHFAISCVTCHDPHASTLFSDEEINPNKGIRQQCEACHWQQEFQNNRLHGGTDCTDCHMPPMGKSAVGNLDIFTGDIKSHLFSINPDPEAVQFSEDGTLSNPYITLNYACRQCHNGEYASEKSDEELSAMADGYHTPPIPTPEPPAPEVVVASDAVAGELLFQSNCSGCHGEDATGVSDRGNDLTSSPFVLGRSNEDLLQFIIQGRPADDPQNISGRSMPARGGSDDLSDLDIGNIIVFLRTLQPQN